MYESVPRHSQFVNIRTRFRTMRVWLPVLISVLLVGCGKSEPETQAVPENSARATNAVSSSSATNTKADSPDQKSASSGRRMIGDIPLDVWFDDPLTVAASGTNITPTQQPATTPEATAMSGDTTQQPAQTAETEVAAAGWNDSISGDVIAAEVTEITNYMRTKLQSVGQFKQAIFELPVKSATLSVLAQIAIDHPDDIRWKKNAAYIRDLAAPMHTEKLQPTRKFFEPLSEAHEKIAEIMSGNSPSGPAPDAEADFLDLADMRLLMMRMEVARDKMKTDAGNESNFKAESDMIRHESAVLRTLMKICLTEGYGYADDEDFVGLAKPILDATKKMQDATDTDDFETYDAGLSTIFQSCSECHTQYKNN